MAEIIILAVSVLLQLTAATQALRMIRVTGGIFPWLALSVAIILMTVRRVISLYISVVNYPETQAQLNAELVALVVSILVLFAVIAIRPLFASIRRSEQALAEQIRRNQVILESSPDGFWILDMQGRLLEVNSTYAEISGYSVDELIGVEWRDLVSAEDGARVEQAMRDLPGKDSARIEVRHRCKDGAELDVEMTAKYVQIKGSEIIYVFSRDITDSKRARAELFEQKERAQVTLSSIGDGVMTTDVEGRVQYLNPMAEQLCGLRTCDALNRPTGEVMRLVDENSLTPMMDPVEDCIESGKRVRLQQHSLLQSHDDESSYSVEVMVSPIRDSSGQMVGTVLILHDVTELRGMARQLSYQATHDPLTGLINRREFESRLEKVLERARYASQPYAVCYIDLDEFKMVNDTCGHVAGDEMLKQVARILEKGVRESDTLARLGGDEFGILLCDCPLPAAQSILEKLRNTIREFRFAWENNVFETGISVGLVPIDPNSGTLTDILSAADSACYVAKERGRNCIHVFMDDDKAIVMRHGQMRWVQRIQRALSEGRFKLYFQRIRPLHGNGKLRDHAEVLLRMLDEEGKIVMPNTFLPAAERYHLMPAIDRWVVQQVFKSIASSSCLAHTDVDLCAINLSGQSLGETDFLAYVEEHLQRYQVDPGQICFEITETAVIANIAQARRFITILRELGCKFALDDFGSGLSSFSYLKSLPVDYLKIDGNFVRSLLHDTNDYNLVVSINQIGHVMGIDTIAEFVEDEATLAALSKIGVDYAQGYVIAKPMPVA